MQGLNRVELIGNLGSDPQMRYTASGKAVTNLRLAVTTGFGESADCGPQAHIRRAQIGSE